MKKDDFLDLLDQRLNEVEMALKDFQKESLADLSKRKEDKWNVLENIEHLKRYNAFYLPEFEKTLRRAPAAGNIEMVRGKFGSKSAKSMLPGEEAVTNPMKTFRSKNPKHSRVEVSVLTEFQKEQEQLKSLIQFARSKDIGRVKCRTTLPLIRFILGDALEFVINHQVRHIAQAKRALKQGS